MMVNIKVNSALKLSIVVTKKLDVGYIYRNNCFGNKVIAFIKNKVIIFMGNFITTDNLHRFAKLFKTKF